MTEDEIAIEFKRRIQDIRELVAQSTREYDWPAARRINRIPADEDAEIDDGQCSCGAFPQEQMRG